MYLRATAAISGVRVERYVRISESDGARPACSFHFGGSAVHTTPENFLGPAQAATASWCGAVDPAAGDHVPIHSGRVLPSRMRRFSAAASSVGTFITDHSTWTEEAPSRTTSVTSPLLDKRANSIGSNGPSVRQFLSHRKSALRQIKEPQPRQTNSIATSTNQRREESG